jgi:hypothetical protein
MAPSKRPARRVPRADLDERDIDEDGDGEVVTKPKPRVKSAGAAGIRGGWTEGQRQMDSTSSFAQTLRLEEKTIIIKFLEDQPYANFRRHWVKRHTKDGETNRPYTCPQTFDKTCPLCEAGDRPHAVASFNVALVGDDGQVLLKSWDCGPRLFNNLKGYANDPKIAPLTKGFFLVSKTGTGGTTQHNVNPIKASSLEEDYDVTPPDQAELDRLERYGPDIVDPPDMKTLRELAEEIQDEYE